MRFAEISNIRIGQGHPLALIAGPCVIENETMVLQSAEKLARVCEDLGLGFVFKCSYLKDNRTAAQSFVGPASS